MTATDSGAALLDAFDAADRAIVARGRRAPAVGVASPSLTFRSFSGGELTYDALERVIILAFVGPDCPRCSDAVQKLATLSVVYYEDLKALAVASAGSASEVAQTVIDTGGEGLVLGAEDLKNAVATGLKIKTRPTLVVVGPTGTVDALWTEDVPLNVLYGFLKAAYDIEGGREKPLQPLSDTGGVEDG